MEKCEADEVPLLDILLFKPEEFRINGRFAYKHYTKPSSCALPLCPTSCHPPSCHVAWPVAYVKSLGARCSNQTFADEAKQIFINKYAAATGCTPVVKILEKTNTFPDERPEGPARKSSERGFFLTLPYTTEWDAIPIGKMIHKLNRKWKKPLKDFTGYDCNIRIAWARGYTSTMSMIRTWANKF